MASRRTSETFTLGQDFRGTPRTATSFEKWEKEFERWSELIWASNSYIKKKTQVSSFPALFPTLSNIQNNI